MLDNPARLALSSSDSSLSQSRAAGSERDRRKVERPTERVRRSQDVDVGFIVLKGSTRTVKRSRGRLSGCEGVKTSTLGLSY
jgi:hypothetical protein